MIFCLHLKVAPASLLLKNGTYLGFRLLVIKHIATTSAEFKDIAPHTSACP